MQIDFTVKSSEESSDIALVYTKTIIDALKKKVKEYNSIGGERVTFQQLKDLFIEGASIKVADKTVPQCGFARINLYLRLLGGESITQEIKEITVSRIGNKLVLDCSASILPSEADFTSAAEDLNKFKINFDLTDIEELYFVSDKDKPFLGEYL